ncbi:MAG: ATP-grasp domain-containing protein [Xanthomonadales bacterium]
MIIASGPYISSHFVATVSRNGWPVLDAGGAAEFGLETDPRLAGPEGLRRAVEGIDGERILTTGEHALGFVAEHFPDSRVARAARLFKDKAAFRRSLEPLFPDLWFTEIEGGELHERTLPDHVFPFVIKPSVGFFSIGVRIVRRPSEWDDARDAIRDEVAAASEDFPGHVLNRTRFLLESYIDGDEYAVDACYDAEGAPVIFNILQHRYASDADVSDRLYVSSQRIVDDVMPDAMKLLDAINGDRAIRNFPLHAEFRRRRDGRLVPIEINPLRFGGWCTTGDFAHFAWGFNSYALYMNGARPDWRQAFAGRADREFGLVVLDNDTGIAPRAIRDFDYDALLARFSKPLHLNRMDYRRFPLFGFLFVETPEADRSELDWILRAGLREFVR